MPNRMAGVGSAMVFGVSVVGHAILLIGVFFTAEVFRRARRNTSAVKKTPISRMAWPTTLTPKTMALPTPAIRFGMRLPSGLIANPCQLY